VREIRPTILGVEQSITNKHWVARADGAQIDDLVQGAGLDHLRAALLAGRRVTPEAAQTYLTPSLRTDMPDPSVLMDMDKAAARILDAIEADEKIVIFSDYDVDGGTSAAQLIRWGRGIGYDFGLHVPDRIRDGYGPSCKAFETLKVDGTDLVVTLDCGAAAHEALEGAADIDLPVVVVDHHLMDGLPPAEAIVNPNRPDDESGLGYLAAAGVTFLLLVALNRAAKARGLNPALDLRELLALTALGTVCDVVPMVGLNRAFVRQGMKVMSQQRIAGLNALAAVSRAEPPFTRYHAGFVLGPRINAGGRIGRSEMGAELLATDDLCLAHAHAVELDRLNMERRTMQDDMLRAAIEQAERQSNRAVIVASMEGWHPGVIGIVAGRLKDRFETPSIVIGVQDDGIAKGSGRSIKGVDLGTAFAVAKKEGLLISGGGHEMAGGLTIEASRIHEFSDWLEERLSKAVSALKGRAERGVDSIVSSAAITTDLLDVIDSVGPYGPDNAVPVFALNDVRLSYVKPLKGGHVRFTAESRGGGRANGILFRGDETALGQSLLDAGDQRLHLLGQVRRNRYQGRESADFHLIDAAWA
jgi:single-stranded-DNA-specific exonuclease